jgi:hypothetical protein
MRLEITRIEGRRNDLLLRLDRTELRGAQLSVANRDRLMALPGMPRHREASATEAQGIADAKLPIEAHLERLGVVDGEGQARRRAIAISNRNLGTNHGHVAWQRGEQPRLFRIQEDPILSRVQSFLTVGSSGGIADISDSLTRTSAASEPRERREPAKRPASERVGEFEGRRPAIKIEELEIDPAQDRLLDRDGRDACDRIEWATVGQRVVRAGRVTPIDEIAAHFYDVRHVLAFDARRDEGERIRQETYDGYPATVAANVQRAWRDRGVPRARYVHNAVGVNANEVIVVQREGTIEEIGQALLDAGAEDGVILDNGGSVVCWVWWANDYRGGIISPTVDYRPPGTSAIVFELKGPVKVDLPVGSVSYSTW